MTLGVIIARSCADKGLRYLSRASVTTSIAHSQKRDEASIFVIASHRVHQSTRYVATDPMGLRQLL